MAIQRIFAQSMARNKKKKMREKKKSNNVYKKINRKIMRENHSNKWILCNNVMKKK